MSGRQWTFTFTAASAAGESVSQSRTLTEQAPTVTSTTVVMDFTSSATDGLSNSLTVDYTASLTATCSYFDGTTGTCALPDGSVSYELTARTGRQRHVFEQRRLELHRRGRRLDDR